MADVAPVPLESILCTEELDSRPSRAPEFEKESRALVALTQALSDSPQTILQTLADTILDILRCGSAGISLLTTNDGGKTILLARNRWYMESTHRRGNTTRFWTLWRRTRPQYAPIV